MTEMANHKEGIEGVPSPKNRGRTLRILAAIGVVISCLVGVCGFFFLRPHGQRIEVHRADLELREGRLYLKGQSKPFFGVMLEYYPGGARRSRSQLANGVLNGISEGWHTNGQLDVQEYFKEGFSHGLRVKWYPTGVKMSEVMISEGKLNGAFRRWHENGTLAERINLKNGNADGLSEAYYPSGFMKAQVRLVAGKPVDPKFWKDGETKGLTTGSAN
jgi:antitoxin component YwqK of YwqJK toxin-antitoxin module